jgi:hypothetical protein
VQFAGTVAAQVRDLISIHQEGSDTVQQRVAELVERSKDGSISAEDQSELEDYLQLEHIMIMAKARARQHTQLGQ